MSHFNLHLRALASALYSFKINKLNRENLKYNKLNTIVSSKVTI